MYIGGPEGSGKSRVIDALKDFLEARDEKRRFKHSSYPGVAARDISGMTLRAAPGLRQKGESQKMGKTLRDIMTIWEGVDYLFIDEITMVGCALLYEISSPLKRGRVELTSYLLGTFSQLPPVGQNRLYAQIDPDTKKKQKCSGIRTAKAGTAISQKDIFDKLLWLSVKQLCYLLRLSANWVLKMNRF
jgi:hypothetical protein